jgi:hypothetical protein
MIAFWATGKKGAFVRCDQPTPLDDGRFCRITDLEDGSLAVPTYGRTVDEVLAKIERTGMHARLAVTQATRTPGAPVAPAAPKPARRLALTADEQMLATTQLADPQNAPRAIARLFESATGIDTEQLAAQAFQERATAWESGHPELKDHAFNKRLIVDNALLKVGGNIRLVDATVLEQSFQELNAGGYLLTQEDLAAHVSPQALPVPPEETPASRTRQTDPAFATSHRLNRTGSTQPPQWQPKYTREQVDRMPLAQSERLWRNKDKDWLEANEHWYPSVRQARA